ncbi:aldolase [Exidia glandulosa HHB12029]|uniref:Transaldolase n=1 Tax=Exidia glandulosa HHB12029 TaxID=1314781 RepID=A0A165F675_EXIGL|nr:aldolase [Exidia glandulosa HHB12029]
MSLLDQFRKDTVLDLDANDDEAAVKYGPFGNMTSNQGIVLTELKKARHAELIREGALQALQDLKDGTEKDVSAAQLAVDWMTVKLGAQVIKHLASDGCVLAQTNPSLAYSTPETVEHARRFVRLYNRVDIPISRICIKVPSTLEGLRACKILGAEHGIQALGTMVLSVEQGIAAGEEAKCLNTSPYCNPLEVHFTPSTHVNYKDPVEEMPGMRMTAQIQRQFKRRGVKTKVLAASLITIEETLSLSGVDRATLGISMLEMMSTTQPNAAYEALRKKAIASYDASFVAQDEIPTDVKFPLEEPATALKAALARPEVAEGMKNALRRFTEAENECLGIAEKALQAIKA